MVVEYLLPATVLASSLAMVVYGYRVLNSLVKEKVSLDDVSTSYRSLVAELEIRREAIKRAIISVLRQAEEGKIPEDVKDALIRKFEGDLEEIERQLKKYRLYAELERLREEYNNLVKEYESKKVRLEEKIRELEGRLGQSSQVKVEETVEKEGEEEGREKKRKRREEDELEELYKEISKIIEEYGVE